MNINDLDEKKLYYVGGVVRDKILGIQSRDVDYVYEGGSKWEGQTTEFGTLKINGHDIAMTRLEEYPRPGHLPVVTKLGVSIEEDAARRDFTVNALYQGVGGGQVLDPTGKGLEDLKTKTLRVLHDKSFIDDPTRIIRALKFALRFGFELDEYTKALQEKYLANVNYDMCYKRVKDELKDTLTSAAAYNRFVEQGIYKLITPNEINTAHPVRADMSWIVYAGLLGDLSRLELTREEQKILKDYGNPQTDLEIYHAFKDAPHEAALLHGLTKDRRAADRWLDYLRQINLQITGDDLKSLGVVPGAAYGEIFDYVLTEKFKNPALTKPEELELARKLYHTL